MATKTPKEIHARRMAAPMDEPDAREAMARVNSTLRGMINPPEGLKYALGRFRLAVIEALECTEDASGMTPMDWVRFVCPLLPSSDLRPQHDMSDDDFYTLAVHATNPYPDVWWPQSNQAWTRSLLQKAALAEELEARGGDAAALVDDLPRLKRWAMILRETSVNEASLMDAWVERRKGLPQPICLDDFDHARAAIAGRDLDRDHLRRRHGVGQVRSFGGALVKAGAERQKAEGALDALKAAIDLVKSEWERLTAVVDIEEGKVPRPTVGGGRKKRGPQAGRGRKAEELIANALRNECDPPWEPAEIAALFRAMMLPESYDPGDVRGLLTKEEAEKLNIRLKELSTPEGVHNLLWG